MPCPPRIKDILCVPKCHVLFLYLSKKLLVYLYVSFLKNKIEKSIFFMITKRNIFCISVVLYVYQDFIYVLL